jgi:hypothetical protein
MTNGQVERMNRTIQEATVNKYFYKDCDELNGHLLYFLRAYNYGKQLKTLRGLTPLEFVMKVWQNEPSRFVINPHHLSPGPYSLMISTKGINILLIVICNISGSKLTLHKIAAY